MNRKFTGLGPLANPHFCSYIVHENAISVMADARTAV